MIRRAVACFFIFGLFVIVKAPSLFADFRVLDAIEEFGERRYVRTEPARLLIGPVRFHPILRNTVEYDSNILLEDKDEREDVIFKINPGVVLDIPVQRHQFAFGYEADFEIFSKSRHARENDQNQQFFALADLNFPSWYINVLDRLRETSGRSGTTFTDRIPRIDHFIHPKMGYRWRRLVVEAGFRHFTRDFRRQIDDSLDFQLVEWTGVVFYDLFARLKALLEYQVAQIDYDDNRTRNGTFQQTRLGLEGQVLPNLNAKLRVGVQFRNYAVSSEPNFNSWVADLILNYAIRENLKLDLSFSREAVESTFRNVNFFRQHLIKTGLTYLFRPQWRVYTNFQYLRHDYAERATVAGRTGFRHDNHFSMEYGLRYDFREWLDFELSYLYLRRDSNFSTFDYTDHRLTLTSKLRY